MALLDRQLAELVAANELWRQRDHLLQSVPGVGGGASHVLIADLPELGQLEVKPLAKLVRPAPLNHNSGMLGGRRAITGGRGTVRTAPYMAALSASRYNPALRAFYQQLRLAGKPFKIAITSCMRKLLTILNSPKESGPGEFKPSIIENNHSGFDSIKDLRRSAQNGPECRPGGPCRAKSGLAEPPRFAAK